MTKAKQNPFVGLRPFENDDSYYYFGRDIQIKALLQRLDSTRFLAVVGSSGSGKSSLVRAGLIPNLEAGFLVQDRDEWQIATMKPGTTPLFNLASALLESMDDDKTSVEEFTAEIESDGVQAILARLKSSVDSEQTNWFLLIDQFEEIFRFGFNNDKGQMHQGAEDFVAILLRLACQKDIPVYVCMTMRSDFLGDCDHFYQLPESMNRSQYLVPRLTREQRREAIAGPIRLARDKITPRLLDHLLNESVDTRDDLPILQHALMRTWDDWNQKAEGAIDVEHYQNIKTVDRALSVHADEALSGLDNDNQKELAKGLFQCLTEVDAGNRRIRRPCHLSEVKQVTGGSAADIMQVINQFRIDNRNFLVISSEQVDEDPLIDISHESLIRQWGTLTAWVDEEAESAKIYLRLAETAERYFNEGGGSYRDADLQLALQWQHKKNPNEVWAKRYHSGFTEAEKFLVESTKIEEREKDNKYNQQLKTLRLTRYFAVMVLIFLAITGYFVWYAYDLKYEVEIKNKELNQQNLKANYHLAKIFEEKTERELKNAKAGQDKVGSFRRAWLYATEALSQNIVDGKYNLSSKSISGLFNPKSIQYLFSSQRWFSPHIRLGVDINSVAFSSDGKTVVTGASDKTVRIWDVSSGRELKQLIGHTGPVNSVAFNPDGNTVISGAGSSEGANFNDDIIVRMWDVSSGRELKQLKGHAGPVNSVAFSPDGKTVVTGSADTTVRLWEVSSGRELKELAGHNDNVNSVAFSPDGKTVVSGAWDNTVRLWDVSSGQELKQLNGHTGPINSVAISPNGNTVVSVSGFNYSSGSDDTVRFWEISSGRELKQLEGHNGPVNSVAFSPDGKTVVTGSTDRTVRIWDVISGRELKQLAGHTGSVNSVTFSSDGKTVFTGASDDTMRMWDVSSGRELKQLTGHTGSVTSIAFSPDGNIMISGAGSSKRSNFDDDIIVRMWDVSSGRELKQLTGHNGPVNSVAFSLDGKTVVTGSSDRTVRIWEVISGRELKQLTGHTGSVTSVAFSPDGKTVVTGSDDKTVRLWDVSSGLELKKLIGHTSYVDSVAYSPDGKTVVTGSFDKTVRLWDVSSGLELKKLIGHISYVDSVAYSPDGKTVVTGSDDKTVRLWDVSSGRELKQLIGHTGPVNSVAFSPDGKTVVSGADDTTVRLWDAISGLELKQLTGHTDNVNSVAFSPDGNIVVTGSSDKIVRMWDVFSDRDLKQLAGHTGPINGMALSSDGKILVTGSSDKTVRIWDLFSGRELKQLTGHTSEVTSVALSKDSETVVSASEDDTIRMWDVSSGLELKKLTENIFDSTGIAFSPDGKAVVIGSEQKDVQLWDMSSGRELKRLTSDTWSSKSVAFSSDGKTVVSGSWDHTVRLWDVSSGRELNQLKGHSSVVSSVVFSPDGKTVVSGSWDNTVRIWDVPSGRELKQMIGHTGSVISVALSQDGKIVVSASEDNTIRMWDGFSGRELIKLRVYSNVSSIVFSPDEKTVVFGSWDKMVRLWDLTLFNLFIQNNKATEVLLNFSKACEFLWQLKLDGLDVKPNPWKPSIFPQDGYNFSYDKKFRPLLNPPKPEQTKFDQVLEWAVEQSKKTTETSE